MRFAAHEFLETQESLRTKAANIELYGILINMAQDPHLRDILQNQQRRMMNGYQQGVAILQGKGVQVQAPVPHTPQMNVYEQPKVGLNNPTMMPPNPSTNKLSDMTISTLALNMHKMGSVAAMVWASECVDPHVRTYHATSANECQEMAYECWQYMNYKGYYQAPQLADHTMNTMIQAYQPMPMQNQGMMYASMQHHPMNPTM